MSSDLSNLFSQGLLQPLVPPYELYVDVREGLHIFMALPGQANLGDDGVD